MNTTLRTIEITSFTLVKPRITQEDVSRVSMNILPLVGILKSPQLPGFRVMIDIYGRYKPAEKPIEEYQLYLTCTAILTFIVLEYDDLLKNENQMKEVLTMMVSVAYSTMRGIIFEKTQSITPELVLPLVVPGNIPTHIIDEESIQEYINDKTDFVRTLIQKAPSE